MIRYAVLSSGSKANSAVIDLNGEILMIDCGLGPVVLKRKLEPLGITSEQIKAIIVTHTHCDHISNPTFKRLGIPVWCHERHEGIVADTNYYSGPFSPLTGFSVTPFQIFHDSPMTHAFRIDVEHECEKLSIGHIADTGAWTLSMARKLANVDILAVESNHDVDMQWKSDRPMSLIQRNLSKYGHLSNEQCRAFVERIIEYGKAPKHTVLLHMSHHCNTDQLAIDCLKGLVEPIVASQESPSQWFEV